MSFTQELFGSKKFVALLAGMLAVVLKAAGVPIGEDVLLPVLGLVASYILGQGIADNGKEATKLQVKAAKELGAANPTEGVSIKD